MAVEGEAVVDLPVGRSPLARCGRRSLGLRGRVLSVGRDGGRSCAWERKAIVRSGIGAGDVSLREELQMFDMCGSDDSEMASIEGG